MNPIVFALRRPYTVLVAVLAVLAAAGLALYRSKVDVFPSLNQPVVYVCQPYGGMSPTQMEGLLTSYYEFHFLYVNGVHHVESRNIQGMSLLKVYFHPGTDMAQGLAEVVASVNRSRFMMPPNTVPPFITRMDTGTAGVGYLVLNSTKDIKETQDIATLKVRPMFASVPGISSPPAFGGNQRAIVVSILPESLRQQGLTAEDVNRSLAVGNVVAPSGNLRVDDRTWLVTSNVMVGADPKKELGQVPVKLGPKPILLGDVADITDGSDITAGYSLVNGRRSVYMLVTKRADASTVSVVNELKKALPRLRDAAPGIDIQFVFDQSPIVREAVWGVVTEGGIGAILTGLMVVLFLRDWRSVIVVVLNIPLALLAAVFALWVCDQTVNLMTLGGLALAVGILVDEATVEVENIHSQMERTESLPRAVRAGNQETAVPRLLAMLCVLAVFVPSFFMEGATRELFVPLSLAVGFSMIASYLLSSTFVPVMCVWLLKPVPHAKKPKPNRAVRFYERALGRLIAFRWVVAPVALIVALVGLLLLFNQLGTAVFPPSDNGQFQFRLRAPSGTRIERTEELAQHALKIIDREAGPGNVKMSVGYVGMFPTNYPIQAVHVFTSGPDEAILKVALQPTAGIRVKAFEARLRDVLNVELRDWLKQRWTEEGVPAAERETRAAGLSLSFEPADLVNQVMSFGAASPVEVQISGNALKDTLAVGRRVRDKLKAVPDLRDLQLLPAQDYPTVEITVDRAKAAAAGLTAMNISNSLIPATASSRYMTPIYWRDPKSGQAYIVQLQVPPPRMDSVEELARVPVRGGADEMPTSTTGDRPPLLLRDVAELSKTTTPAEIARYNMRRFVSVSANVATADLGRVARQVKAAIAEATAELIDEKFLTDVAKLKADGKWTTEAEATLEAQRQADRATAKVPGGVRIDVRGQIATLDEVQRNLAIGLVVAVVAILLLLTAYFQSVLLALVALAGVPLTLCGVALALLLTGTTLNLQSFMGAIMAVGVSVANAILLVTFAEKARVTWGSAARGALEGGIGRLRAILMTSCAMVAGMLPMAFGFGSGGDQTAPLGRAVVGGLVLSTVATLFVLPAVFALVMGRSGIVGASLDPDDPHSARYDADKVTLFPSNS